MRKTFFSLILSSVLACANGALCQDRAETLDDLLKSMPAVSIVETDRMALETAQKHLAENRLDAARDGFARLAQPGHWPDYIDLAQVGLADVYEKQGDRAALIRQLEAISQPKPAATSHDRPNDHGIRQDAIERLAKLYFKEQDYRRAEEKYTQWRPSSFCGTCVDAMSNYRGYMLLLCRLHLGEQVAVARELLAASDKGLPLLQAELLFRLYDEAHQADALTDLADGLKENAKYAPAYLLRIRKLGAQKDVATLIALCRNSNYTSTTIEGNSTGDWNCRCAADISAPLLGNDVTPVIADLDKMNPSRLIYVLGKNGSPQALVALVDRARNDVGGHEIRNVMYAISLHGEPGKLALKQLADEREDYVGARARERLTKADQDDPMLRAWPKPPRGSLPLIREVRE